ncbi:DUF805 domain-containing protein [Erythrobacter sp. MTPC3]|uniref:DUF805 domain-containing protein n=1 Tax=Erythrobacter sp. MTPC3 TaxID=3056564 RepID=UPI0036F3CC26
MWNAIRYNLAHLGDLSGRDGRATFWFYVLFLVVLQYAIGMIISLPMLVGAVTKSVGAISAGTSEEEIAASMMTEMAGYLETQMLASIGVGLIILFLITAAFVRRLHDAGFAGWIAAIPVAAQLFSLAYGFAVIDDIMALMQNPELLAGSQMRVNPIAIQAQVAPLSFVGWLGYLVVIAFGVLKSQPGPNKYGGVPV